MFLVVVVVMVVVVMVAIKTEEGEGIFKQQTGVGVRASHYRPLV